MIQSIKSLTGSDLHRFGRFLAVRKAYSLWQYQHQRRDLQQWEQRLNIRPNSLFNGVNVDDSVAQIRQEAVCFGLQLPSALVDEIEQFARQTPCTEPGFNGSFLIDEVRGGQLNGRPVLRALVGNLASCDAIAPIEQDPTLLQIVRSYLGYYPTRITRHLTWSVVPTSLDYSHRFYPPTTFHYDIAGFNFMTTYFYITDVDVESGPHVMIRGSHVQKPLWMVLSSGRHSDQAVYNHYGKSRELVIEGKRGFGFMQDPSCIHKVLPPTQTNRLLLQLRYS